MVHEYIVGGFVRDLLIHIEHPTFVTFSKTDKDYAVEADSYEEMKEWVVLEKKGEIKVESPEYFTIRALVPTHAGKQIIDYTLCRKESAYTDGRHPDAVMIGDIYDDLSRRDFTMNAIALDPETNKFIDPWGGRQDIIHKQIRCVGNGFVRMQEDYLRLLRALRFSVTLGFSLDFNIIELLYSNFCVNQLIETISEDRIREELTKMFKNNTLQSFRVLNNYPYLTSKLFETDTLWLKPTMEQR
jgi:poly(A) polymerase/tRNA nucleotidyltransferase (CCA-adding enzyme)